LLKISEGRLGLVCVGGNARVEGVITDGDIRRAIAHSSEPNTLIASEIATTNPVFIEEGMGLNDMNVLFREKKIVSLLVGSKTNFKGVVQFYDLHKM
jgi:arabinose-5-phosphate isomerase